jgi:hypothetical protein
MRYAADKIERMKTTMRLAIPLASACLLSAYGAFLFAHFGGAGNILASAAGLGVVIKTALSVA